MARWMERTAEGRTRADRVFLRARPAALRTWTGEDSLTSSDESISMYAGWWNEL